jgi:hypothetical protein
LYHDPDSYHLHHLQPVHAVHLVILLWNRLLKELVDVHFQSTSIIPSITTGQLHFINKLQLVLVLDKVAPDEILILEKLYT